MTEKVPSLVGERFLVVQPTDERGIDYDEPLIAMDTISAAPGQTVYFVEKREAAKAFGGRQLPSDVTILGIVDEFHISDTPPSKDSRG